MFNIETYLDSLPDDIEEINVSDKGITYLDVSRFKNLKILYCHDNRLTSLLLNENLQQLYCEHNRLTSLRLNEKLRILFCNYNQLTYLQFNEKLRTLYCSHNKFTYLQTDKLVRLYCPYNQLTCLHLNENLEELYCYNNQLTSLHLNEKLETIVYSDNPIYEIINTNDKNIIKQKMQILTNFRYLYYCLKYKKQFRYLLWVKIREPKIRERYSHDYLVKNLHEDTDLDDLLENW